MYRTFYRAFWWGFGGIAALDAVGFDLRHGMITGAIGPNGAGKTPLFNCLSSLYEPATATSYSRAARFSTGQHTALRSLRSAARPRISQFHSLSVSVLDNVRIGGHSGFRHDYFSDALGMPWKLRNERIRKRMAHEISEYPGLTRDAFERTGSLPLGVQ